MLTLLVSAAVAKAPEGELVWGGIDFGAVRCVGTGDFREPGEIFPGYFSKWNALFLDEYSPVLQKKAKVASVVNDLEHLTPLHAVANPESQIIRDDLFDVSKGLDPAFVKERVQGYTLEQTSGTLFTLVADQLHKPTQQGCYWVVTMDIASREVRTMDRTCAPAMGIGFRNYWFGTIKHIIDHLPKEGK